MSDVFTSFVRLLARGQEPDLASFDEVLEHLRALLVTEMRKRSLWTAPPSYLGVVAKSWTEPGAFEELVLDAYDFCFTQRLSGLSKQSRVNDNIQGFVVLNLRHFLTDRQRRADPLGYRIYSRLRQAVEKLVKAGSLFLRDLVRKIRRTVRSVEVPESATLQNSSVLAFKQDPSVVAGPAQLEEPVTRWNDRLMPELVIAEGTKARQVVDRLSDEVETLPAHGIDAVPFGDLAKALKDDARARWLQLWHQERETAPEDGEPGAEVVPLVPPDPDFEERCFRAAVLEAVEQEIAAVHPPKKQRDLWTLWLHLRISRLEAGDESSFPSYSELGRQIEMPRERVSQLLDELKSMVRRCLRNACAEPNPAGPAHEALEAQEGR